jgi:hypothetical protein
MGKEARNLHHPRNYLILRQKSSSYSTTNSKRALPDHGLCINYETFMGTEIEGIIPGNRTRIKLLEHSHQQHPSYLTASCAG